MAVVVFYSAYYHSPVGRLRLLSDGERLTGLKIGEPKYSTDMAADDIREQEDLPVFIRTRAWLDDYFQGKNPHISSLPLSPRVS